MTLEEIQAAIDELDKRMGDMDLPRRSSCEFCFQAHKEPRIFLSFFGKDMDAESISGDTPRECFDKANAWLDRVGSKEERELAAFRKAVAGVIDKGRALGVDTSYVNPLTEMMKSLSSNALTYQPEDAA